VANSSAEVEYMSAWEVAINMTKNPLFHSKTKHVDTKYHFIRTLINNDIIKPKYCPSEDQTSNIFTKPLGKIKFNFWTKGGELAKTQGSMLNIAPTKPRLFGNTCEAGEVSPEVEAGGLHGRCL
jgi:hypothetical protein